MNNILEFEKTVEKMKTLLEKIKVLEYKYKILEESDTFNIFTVLRNESDEVNLHSRFLATLLDPKGNHKKKQEFLIQFLLLLKIESFDLKDLVVQKEYKNIDILVRNSKQAIIIENKLWASDQKKQIQRYYETLKGEGVFDIKIVYLTLDGRYPSDYSLGNLRNDANLDDFLICASYDSHIQIWIEECVKISATHPSLRETLIQYKKLIAELTGTTMHREEIFEIMDLLGENDNVFQAQKIASNWKHIKWHTENFFWKEFEQVILKEFKILDLQKYSDESLTKVIHGSRNKDFWYGIMFEIANKENLKYSIFIERGVSELYYGLTIVENRTNRELNNESRFDHLAESLKDYLELERTNFWIGRNYLMPKINFESFVDETTLKLVNKDFRKKYIGENWINIKKFIAICLTKI